MTIDDITKCLVCEHDELTKFKNYKKCKKCSAKMGVSKGKSWYEFNIPIEKTEENN